MRFALSLSVVLLVVGIVGAHAQQPSVTVPLGAWEDMERALRDNERATRENSAQIQELNRQILTLNNGMSSLKASIDALNGGLASLRASIDAIAQRASSGASTFVIGPISATSNCGDYEQCRPAAEAYCRRSGGQLVGYTQFGNALHFVTCSR